MKLIFDYLEIAYTNGEDVEARRHMQRASYLAGMAFTQAYVGYVHAVAHTLGGFYHIPHGLANAVLLPHVLELYGASAYTSLEELVEGVGIDGDTEETRAKKFIQAIRALNESMGIPTKLDGIQNRDIPIMVERAHQEAVPRFLSKDELFYLYQIIQP